MGVRGRLGQIIACLHLYSRVYALCVHMSAGEDAFDLHTRSHQQTAHTHLHAHRHNHLGLPAASGATAGRDDARDCGDAIHTRHTHARTHQTLSELTEVYRNSYQSTRIELEKRPANGIEWRGPRPAL